MGGYTCNLEEIDSGSLALAGGKGASLGELSRARLPVPAAFCITTLAYRRLIEAGSLLAPILAELDGLDYDEPAEIERRARAIREMILATGVPAEIDGAIRDAYEQLEEQLGAGLLVSVRSSATAEDLPGMSFAGQQDSYLNIHGADAVLDHVKRCWASLWTGRAISYRHQQGFRHEEVLLAVVVQEMFPSEVSGVLFTANPITSNPDELLLNTSWGLGEAIVSGRVDPDQYIVDKHSLAIRDKRIHDKRVMSVRQGEGQGSTEVAVPDELRSVETLPDEKIRELCEIGLRIEAHFGFPQDIEWGHSNGRFAILQSREVTGADIDFHEGMEAWQTPAALAELTNERWVWSRAYSDELQTGPSTPLMYTFAQPHRIKTKLLALEYAGITGFAGYRSESYLDMPLFRWYGARAYYNTSIEKEWMRIFIPPFARDAVALLPFPEEERDEIRNMPFDWFRFIRMMLKLELTHPTRSLLGSTHHLYENFYLYVLPHGLGKLCELWCDDEDARIFSALVAGLKTPPGEQNAAVWELSRKIKRSPVLMELMKKDDPREILDSLEDSEDGRRFKADFDPFLAAFGHRGANERDPFHFRWRQKPERVFPSLKPLLALEEEDSPALFEERLRKRMLETKEECLRKIRKQPIGSLKAAFFKWILELVQDYFYYRDWERFQNDRDGMHFRPLLTKVGRMLVERGLLADDGQGLRGTAASSGTVTGRARVCRSLDQISRIEKHDILVTVATDPAWTTVFSIIAGVVVETGGVVSHAVMISREYGIPCVANMTRACELIPDGATITVDGSSGRVLIHGDA